MPMTKHVCLHGHFYQPPRQNPWLEVVEVQDSAAPFHDWNQRVCAECYEPNASARILNPDGTIGGIVNNYEHISFNFGPTLLDWLEEFQPKVLAALVEADQNSLARLGAGNALAQVYNHVIMPLAGLKDKITQIRWGQRDFERRFGRAPQGMWLAETAVDTETLECLAGEGLEFTILAPRQAAQVRSMAGGGWRDVSGGGLDPKMPYLVSLPGGKEISVFFYDGPLSRAVAFDGLLDNGETFKQRIQGAIDENRKGAQLISLATDGESYGHHHRFGEMALAYALKALGDEPEVELTNFAAFLKAYPPTWEARIVEQSSWSCAHGVERWRSDCGCAIDPGGPGNQAWRAPMRQGLDDLKAKMDDLFQAEGGQLCADPWALRDDFVEVLLAGDHAEKLKEVVSRHAGRELSPEEMVTAAKLLEMQRWAMFMFTSCGWFFDDIAGLEAVQNLRFAARALQLASELGAGDWEETLLQVLDQAKSNQALEGTGRDIWQRHVAPVRVGRRRTVAHAAISGVLHREEPPEEFYCFRIKNLRRHFRRELDFSLVWGQAEASHYFIGEKISVDYAALHTGGHEFTAFVCPLGRGEGLDGMDQEVAQPMSLQEKTSLLGILERRLPGRRYSLGDIFLEGRRRLAQAMLSQTLDSMDNTATEMFNANKDVMLTLRGMNVPLPRPFDYLAETVITGQLISEIKGLRGVDAVHRMESLAALAKALGVAPASPALKAEWQRKLAHLVEQIRDKPKDTDIPELAAMLLELAASLKLGLEPRAAQNIFYELSRSFKSQAVPGHLAGLARDLGFAASPRE